MLVRERNNILNIVTNAWGSVGQAMIDDARKTREIAVAGYMTDSLIVDLANALDGIGVSDAGEVAWAVANKQMVVRSMVGLGASIGYRTTGLVAEIETAKSGIRVPEIKYIHAEPAYQELDLALSMAKTKWTDLQSPLYALMADLGCATDYDGIRMGIRKFTASIA